MEENRYKNAELLSQEELEHVAGGIDDPKDYFATLAEVENSPVFDKLKKWLGRYKNEGHSKTSGITVERLRSYFACLDYIISDKAALDFIRKYWDQV